jgi:ubiquinone/menaquinone biosynthesis C-methylase UbiE
MGPAMVSANRQAFDALAEWYDHALRGGELPLFNYVLYPCIIEMLGDVSGKQVLDLACGPGFLTLQIARRGAEVIGVDVSEEMLRRAREEGRSAPRAVTYYEMDATHLAQSWDSSFDVVTCNMAMVDMPDIDAVLAEMARVLKPYGRYIFAITHPCFVMPGAEWVDNNRGEPVFKRVDNYFDEGYFGKEWYGQGGLRSRLGGNHRTLQSYIRAMREAGFVITDLREPRPAEYALRANKQLATQMRIPSMLVIEGTLSGPSA